MEGDLDLALLPLVDLVRPPIPDRHRPGAVLALGDLPVEVEILERVVLGADREPILTRVGRDPVRDRPRRQRPVVLEPEVPVKARRVVLLDDEARLGAACALRTT